MKPYVQQEGLELVSDSGVTIAQLKAAVLAKSVKWDVIEFTEADYFLLVKEDLLEPIDYSVWTRRRWRRSMKSSG